MLATRIQDNSIRIICSNNQIIDTKKLKTLYRTVLRFIHQNGNLPIIVDAGRNVSLSNQASKLFKRIEKCSDKTLIIIAG
jgi:ABC-type lipoprotein export system ATPase subunit